MILNSSGANRLLSYPVHVCAALSDVPSGVILVLAAFNLEQGCVFVLVPQAPLEASEHGLGVQSSGLGCHCKLDVVADITCRITKSHNHFLALLFK